LFGEGRERGTAGDREKGGRFEERRETMGKKFNWELFRTCKIIG
jgi:hypothetical protein